MKYKKQILKFAPLALIIFCAVSLYSLIWPSKYFLGEDMRSENITVNVMGQECSFNVIGDNSTEQIYTMTSLVPMSFAVSEYSGVQVKINGVPFLSGEKKKLIIETLSKDTYISVEFFDLNNNKIGEAKISTLPLDSPSWSFDDPNLQEEDGKYFLAIGTYVYILDEVGNIKFYRNAECAVSDFKMHEINGKHYYSFFSEVGDRLSNQISMSGLDSQRVARLVLDENFMLLDWVEFMEPGGFFTDDQLPIENNCFIMLGERDYLIASYKNKRVANIPADIEHSDFGARVAAVVLQRVQNDTVVFEWDSTAHPELYGLSVAGNDYFNQYQTWADYAHLESVFLDIEDQNYICVFRNLNSILKIDHETGAILWYMCGKKDQFGLGDILLIQNGTDVSTDGTVSIANLRPAPDSAQNENLYITEISVNKSNLYDSKRVDYICQTIPELEISDLDRIRKGCFLIGWNSDTGGNGVAKLDCVNRQCVFELITTEQVGGCIGIMH